MTATNVALQAVMDGDLTSVAGYLHFLRERTHPAAQGEIREYVEATRKLAELVFGGWLP